MVNDSLDGLGDRVFVTDFDGTMTQVDFFDVVWNAAPAGSIPDYWGRCEQGELTHVAALDGIFRHAPRDPNVLASYLAQTRLDPQTPAAVDRLRQHGWEVVVVSAGASWYIEQLLTSVRDRVRIIANPSWLSADEGLRMTWPAATEPWYSAHFGVDKGAIVRTLQARGAMIAFAGDGRPDLTAARMVNADLRFARSWLAGVLEREGLAYRPFEKWSEIAAALCP